MTITRKLLLPLLIFLAIVLVTVQAYQARRDANVINQQEEQDLTKAAEVFQNRLDSLNAFALALAMEVANNPEVQAAFAAKDRERLIELTLPAYEQIDAQFDVPQHQFHLPPATSFLRLHQLDRFGDDLSSFRNTVLAANASKQPTSGLEIGRGGLGIRGVVPVNYKGEHIGTVEFGLNVDQTLINTIKKRFGNDWQILLRQDPAEVAIFEGAVAGEAGPTPELFLQASTLEEPIFTSPETYVQVLDGQNVFSPQIEQNDQSFEVYSFPLLDFSGNVIGVVDIVKDRAPLVNQQSDRNLYFAISTLVILVVTGLGLGIIAQRNLRPIGKLTETATAIAAGDLDTVALVESKDEIGTLATAFNTMAVQVRSFIGELEKRVQDRTRDLALAAEVGRNLAQIRDLDILLKESSELIRERFNLYHVQIYLTDATEKSLILRAGTGEAAKILLERRHSLVIASGSINGSAALDKKTVIVADTRKSSIFRPNPLLPDTRSEMAVPLLLGDRVLGVLDLQSSEVDSLSEETLPAFETLASQLAISIDNANLLTVANQARSEVEAYLQRLTREGWADYLNAINREEKLTYVYDSKDISIESERSMAHISDEKNVLRLPITVIDEPIGVIQVEADDDRHWTDDAIFLVTSVAERVAQQIENLRLMEEAERYRTEAEAALRRITFEGWQAYAQDEVEVARGYLYDQNQVHPLLDADDNSDLPALKQSIQVRDETIGILELKDVKQTPETVELLQLVSARLSEHLENLRLSQQTEKALAETAKQSTRLGLLNDLGRDLSAISSTEEIFEALSQYMHSIIPHDHLTLILLKPGGLSDVMAIVEGKAVILLENQPVAGTLVERIIDQRQLTYLADIQEYDYPDTNAMVEKGVRSAIIAPLITARGVLGIVDVESNKVDAFDAQDESLLQQIASLVASTLDSQQLFAEAQKQAEKERLVNIVSQKIQSTATIESALETTITELGKALQARYTKAELSLVKEAVSES